MLTGRKFANQAYRILGVDPGLDTSGYAVLEVGEQIQLQEAGVVRTSSSQPLPVRLAELYEGLTEVIRSFQPHVMALEEIYTHYSRPRTAILMGHARGVICLAAAAASIPVVNYSATQIKKILTGSGRANKLQMQRAIQRELCLPYLPEPPDVADALAIALCHCYLAETVD